MFTVVIDFDFPFLFYFSQVLHCDAAIVLLSYMFGNKRLNWQKQNFFFQGAGEGNHKGIMLRAPKWLAVVLSPSQCPFPRRSPSEADELSGNFSRWQ